MVQDIVAGIRKVSRAKLGIVQLLFVVGFLTDCVSAELPSELRRSASQFTARSVVPHSTAEPPYAKWKRGPSSKPDYFPIAVWLQSPSNASRYKAAGINLYVGLWKGPNETQLKALTQVGMPVICSQNEFALQHTDDPIIVGWMHGDEPDNAQSLGSGKGYGPPIPPSTIERDYQRLRAKDPSRPVLLNLGQGVAWDGWHGRGVRTNHPEDYREYAKGSDIVSFDIYPACHSSPSVAGNLWYVARGVERLRGWTDHQKPVWSCIECTHISNPEAKATPHQVKAEVWMALIHGAKGIIYFSHQFKPQFIEAGLLADGEMLAGVTRLNHQIHRLALVLNSPAINEQVTVESSNADVPVATMVKRDDEYLYVFAVAMRNGETRASFRLTGAPSTAKVEVLDESRTLRTDNGEFTDTFSAWDVHLYRIPQ